MNRSRSHALPKTRSFEVVHQPPIPEFFFVGPKKPGTIGFPPHQACAVPSALAALSQSIVRAEKSVLSEIVMRKALFILGTLDDSDVDWLLAAGKRQKLATGSVLIEEGLPTENVYIVLEGTFEVRVAALSGKRIAELRAGEIIGEMSFVDSRPPSASVIAVEDSVVLAIPNMALNRRLEDAAFAARFYRSLAIFLAHRMRDTVARLGYGRPSDQERKMEMGHEIGPTALDNVSIAGARLNWMMKRLRGH